MLLALESKIGEEYTTNFGKKNDDGSFKRIFLIEALILEFPPYVACFMYIVQRTELQYDIEIMYEIVHNV